MHHWHEGDGNFDAKEIDCVLYDLFAVYFKFKHIYDKSSNYIKKIITYHLLKNVRHWDHKAFLLFYFICGVKREIPLFHFF